MDHTMGGMTMTSTASAAAATESAAMGDMDHMGSSSCKISMLWNWNTVDACFISSSWKITSPGVMAGSCIGVILLVMSLELLRRAVKEYDHFLVRQNAQRLASVATPGADSPTKSGCEPTVASSSSGYRPNFLQQAIRALLHMLQFAVAYFIMLLAMYYNGYIIICIFIGSYIGSFVFQWETLGLGSQTSATREATVCCG